MPSASLEDFLHSNFGGAPRSRVFTVGEGNSIDYLEPEPWQYTPYQKLMGMTPEQWLSANGMSSFQDAFNKNWTNGARIQYDPNSRSVSYDDHGDKFGPLIMGGLAAGVGALSGGFGLGELLNSAGVDLPWGVNPSTPSPSINDIIEQSGNFTGGGSLMPPAVPELALNNATPGGVTATTGLDNAVTQGLLGTSGAAVGLPSVSVGANSLGGQLATTGATGTTATAGSALSRILDGSGTSADWASVLGTAGSTALGIYGSNENADALRGIADQARSDRQPFLNKSLEWLNNPQSYADGPGKSALDATLRALSVNGNPIGNPTSLAIAGDIANKNWQNAVTGFGNMGLAGQDSRSQLLSNAALADRGVTSSLASGLGTMTQPDNSFDALLRRLRGAGSQYVLD